MKWLALVLASGCGAQVNTHASNQTVDASPGSSVNPVIDAPIPADAPAPTCANGRVVYLNFDGQMLVRGGTSDATTNTAAWLGGTSKTVPAFHPTGLTDRAGTIQTIVDSVKNELSATPIQVVTTRPSAGPYVMIVLGGSPSNVGTNNDATTDHDCGDLVKSDLGWISDSFDPSVVPDVIMGTIGYGLGLDGTADQTDCMCGWENNCRYTGACTLSMSIATSQLFTCQTGTQNEVAAFTTLFCQ
jgi:hypothetical protein